jgi:hypothetical protein
VGIDTSLANSTVSLTLNEAVGQTFLAADTLISTITIWRYYDEVGFGFGVHVFILTTDSNGAPADSILVDGPTVFNYGGDGIHPIPLTFQFDPPLTLPAKGTYEMAFLAVPCSGFFNILSRYQAPDAYPDGIFWNHARSPNPPCIPRFEPSPGADGDIVFTIEFCDLHTPARAPTWGELKVRYR